MDREFCKTRFSQVNTRYQLVSITAALVYQTLTGRELGEGLSTTAWGKLCPGLTEVYRREQNRTCLIMNALLMLLLRSQPDDQTIKTVATIWHWATITWVDNARFGSAEFVRQATLISITVGLLEIRQLWCGGFAAKRKAARVCRGFPEETAAFMMRQGEARNEDEAAHGLSLIALQMWSVYRPRGGQDPRQIIYNVRLAESYVGRTQATHPAASNSGGLAIR